MVQTFLNTVSHKAFKFGFGRGHLAAAPAPSVISDLQKFVQADKQILDSINNGKPLSQGASNRIKDFFVKNEEFNNAMVQSFDKDPHFPPCYTKMKPNQKKKLVKTIIQSMDFAKILNG